MVADRGRRRTGQTYAGSRHPKSRGLPGNVRLGGELHRGLHETQTHAVPTGVSFETAFQPVRILETSSNLDQNHARDYRTARKQTLEQLWLQQFQIERPNFHTLYVVGFYHHSAVQCLPQNSRRIQRAPEDSCQEEEKVIEWI